MLNSVQQTEALGVTVLQFRQRGDRGPEVIKTIVYTPIYLVTKGHTLYSENRPTKVPRGKKVVNLILHGYISK